MDITNAKPSLKSLAISYNDNQPVDLDLWNSIFFSTSLIEIKKFLSSDAQDIMCLLLRIRTFIKQYFLGNKPAKDFLELAEIGAIS